MKRGFPLFVAAALAIVLLPIFVFVISERELAVVLRMGKPVREYTSPGVHFRLPFIETVERFPKTKQFWGGEDFAGIADVTTNDNKKIDLIPWAVWRIQSPQTFVQRLRTIELAEKRVAQITRSVIRDVIAQHDLSELIRSTKRQLPTTDDAVAIVAELKESSTEPLPAELVTEKPNQTSIQLGRAKLLDVIREESKRRLVEQREGEESIGAAIEIVDVGVSQVMFVESVRLKTFDRWISEREAISMLIVKEGEQRKAKILNAAKAEVQKIEGLGQKEASEIKGKIDAQVIKRYAEAISEVGDFYTFTRTLKAYENSINKDSRMILSTDNEFLRMLKSLEPAKK